MPGKGEKTLAPAPLKRVEDKDGATFFGVHRETATLDAEKPPIPANELDGVQRLLAEQRDATLQAQADASELKTQLAEAQAEIIKAKSELQIAQVRAAEAQARVQPATAQIKAQWERAQKDLERAAAARQRDAAQANAKLARVHEALQIAKEARSRESGLLKRRLRLRVLAGVGGTIMAGVGGYFAVGYLRTPPRAAVTVEAKAPPRSFAVTSAPSPATREVAPGSDFSQGLNRLDSAFRRFPGIDPELLMRAVNKTKSASGSSPCAFAWNDGQPALLFGDGNSGGLSLSGSLTRCAEAVEKLH